MNWLAVSVILFRLSMLRIDPFHLRSHLLLLHTHYASHEGSLTFLDVIAFL